MPKTLYISDLDGTLLNKDAEISEDTARTLNKLINNGMNFTIATARTSASVVKMMSGIHLNIPIILMNGVLIYDNNNQRYLKKETLNIETITAVINLMRMHKQTAFMYGIHNNELMTYYENLEHKPMRSFYEERVQRYNKTFTRVDDFNTVKENGILYFTFLDVKEHIETLFNDISKIDRLDATMYKDIYVDDLWYLECFSETASKYNAAENLRKNLKFDKLVGFGDNLNDIPLFKACDECYAVGNAKEEVKAIATGVIGTNDNDGVAIWLKENFLM